jgi:hypothetical protein
MFQCNSVSDGKTSAQYHWSAKDEKGFCKCMDGLQMAVQSLNI